MLKDSQSPRYSVPRTRCTYTPQFKAELITACLRPGASIAATAREHGMHSNVLHRWLKEHRMGRHQIAWDTAPAVACDIAAHCDDAAVVPEAKAQPVSTPAHRPHASAVPAFIAMALGSPVMQSLAANAQAACSVASSDIRIECCHHGTRAAKAHGALCAGAVE